MTTNLPPRAIPEQPRGWRDDISGDRVPTWMATAARGDELDSAIVDVAVLRTQGHSTGCRSWSGDHQLTFDGSQWLIDYANLTYAAC